MLVSQKFTSTELGLECPACHSSDIYWGIAESRYEKVFSGDCQNCELEFLDHCDMNEVYQYTEWTTLCEGVDTNERW